MFKVPRANKENKTEIVSLRLKPSQVKEIEGLKDSLGFKTVTELLCYSMDIFKRLHEWNLLNYHFYIGDPEKKDYKEIEFDI